MLQESGDKKTPRHVDTFTAEALPLVSDLVTVLGGVHYSCNFIAAGIRKTQVLMRAMEASAYQGLVEQAREKGADALFLERARKLDGLVTGSLEQDGIAAKYNPRFTTQHINQRLADLK